MGKINIFLADDHATVREGLKRLIENEPDLVLVGEADNGTDVVPCVLVKQPEVVILDINIPGMNGIEVARALRQQCPKVKVLVLTMHEESSYARAVFEAGALGFMLKRAAAAELIPATRAVAAGEFHLDRRVTSRLTDALGSSAGKRVTKVKNLSERELEALRSIAKGNSNKEVAANLGVSVKTVETYKMRCMDKLGLRSRVEIVRYAYKQGWLNDG